MFKFNKKYFILAIILLIVELIIGFYVHDQFIRPWGGDFLVVILLYCFVMCFLNISLYSAAIYVLIFSYIVEFLQYLHIVKFLGLQKSGAANIIIGNSFAWSDILAYTLGIALVLLLEKSRLLKPKNEEKIKLWY